MCSIIDEISQPERSKREDALDNVFKQKEQGYFERNQLVRYLSTIFPSWTEKHSKEDPIWDIDWEDIVFIRFPEGLFSWHIKKSEMIFFEHLEFKEGDSWDGTTTEKKYYLMRCGALNSNES